MGTGVDVGIGSANKSPCSGSAVKSCAIRSIVGDFVGSALTRGVGFLALRRLMGFLSSALAGCAAGASALSSFFLRIALDFTAGFSAEGSFLVSGNDGFLPAAMSAAVSLVSTGVMPCSLAHTSKS